MLQCITSTVHVSSIYSTSIQAAARPVSSIQYSVFSILQLGPNLNSLFLKHCSGLKLVWLYYSHAYE